jgi:multidrug efflux pump subunit AcrA (membrane-fusion protein)
MNLILLIKKKLVYIPLGIVLISIIGFFIYSATNKPQYNSATAIRREFSEEVSVTGKVVAVNDVNLAFESGGRVTNIPVKVGEKVSKGKILANVNSGDLYASLLDKQARLDSARAQLIEVSRGTRPTTLLNQKKAVDQARDDLVTSIQSAYVTSDDVLRTNIDILFTDPTNAYPNMISFNDGNLQSDLEDERVEIGRMMNMWKKLVDLLEMNEYEESFLLETNKNLRAMRDFLSNLAVASSQFEDSSSITTTEEQTYTSAISAGRTLINAEISSISSASQTFINTNDALILSEEGATPEELLQAQASVKSAEANVLQAQSSLARTSIGAPFDGIVTKVNLRVGEQVSSGAPVVSMISNENFEVESFIPEADIAQIQIGDTGTTTLDAYGDFVPFVVVVTAIDLSETEVEGVSTYKTTLQFTETDSRILSGMTANIDLVSETRLGVLSIPQSAVTSKAGKRTVMVRNTAGKTETRDVRTGSRDNAGNIEVLEGVVEGETIIWLSSK